MRINNVGFTYKIKTLSTYYCIKFQSYIVSISITFISAVEQPRIPVHNPKTLNYDHMVENLNVKVEISKEDMEKLMLIEEK